MPVKLDKVTEGVLDISWKTSLSEHAACHHLRTRRPACRFILRARPADIHALTGRALLAVTESGRPASEPGRPPAAKPIAWRTSRRSVQRWRPGRWTGRWSGFARSIADCSKPR